MKNLFPDAITRYMRKTIGIHLLTACFSAVVVVPTYNSQVRAQDTCNAALDYVKRDINQRLRGKVSSIKALMSEYSPFSYRRKEIYIKLSWHPMRIDLPREASDSQVNNNVNIISSNILLTSYAHRIIRSCNDVARVSVSLYEANPSFSLREDGSIVQDECIEFDRNLPAPIMTWGRQWCT